MIAGVGFALLANGYVPADSSVESRAAAFMG